MRLPPGLVSNDILRKFPCKINIFVGTDKLTDYLLLTNKSIKKKK